MAGLRNTLQIRTTQTQSQIMTPQMQQAIKLLQLSTIELQQQIRQTVDLNPMLEIDDSSISGMEESLEDLVERENEDADDVFDDDASVRSFEIDGSMGKLQIGENGETYTEKSAQEDYDSSSSTESQKSSLENSSSTDEQLSGIENSSASSHSSKGISVDGDDIFEGETVETLHDHLLWQLNLSPLAGMDRAIAEIIIDAIDDSGYLSESLDEIKSCVEKSYPDVTIEDILAILKLIQHYDPIGVGSRNVQECMLIQLNEIKSEDPVLTAAITLVSEHINLLANRDFRTICQKLGIKEDFLKKVLDLITSLKPRPGNLNFSKKNEFVVPDVVVLKNSNGEYT
ncbi:MAG: RNA polymerase factor sigma-54, partial [Succinivibrio sp.]